MVYLTESSMPLRSLKRCDLMVFLPPLARISGIFESHQCLDAKGSEALGGQTALNCAVQLHRNGTLKKYGVKAQKFWRSDPDSFEIGKMKAAVKLIEIC